MKVLTEKDTNLSVFTFPDNKVVEVKEDATYVGQPLELIINPLNSSNSILTEGVTNTPDDWEGRKYFFDGINWTLNPDWKSAKELEAEYQAALNAN